MKGYTTGAAGTSPVCPPADIVNEVDTGAVWTVRLLKDSASANESSAMPVKGTFCTGAEGSLSAGPGTDDKAGDSSSARSRSAVLAEL